MALLLQVMRRPRAEHARADDGDMVLHSTLVGLRDGRRNGSAARPDEERAARHVQLHWRRISFRARPSAPVVAEEAGAAEAAEPGKSPSPRSPSRPGTSASPEAAAEVAAAAGEAAVGQRRRAARCRSRTSGLWR